MRAVPNNKIIVNSVKNGSHYVSLGPVLTYVAGPVLLRITGIII